jgi:5'-nucleotidase
MRILCTNDDGIHAPGLKIVEEIARKLSDDVWVVAPELDQSGVSHSLSLNDPLRLREIGPRHFAVRGTPPYPRREAAGSRALGRQQGT